MRVSDSSPSSTAPASRQRLVPYAIAVAYLLAHIPFLAPSLEDIDSINFALGLHHFDPALHQPHPPGYPVYIALGRASLAVVRAVAPALEAVRADAFALAIWSAIGGAIALLAAWSLFASLTTAGAQRRTTMWAVGILCLAPLFWITGARPMSDMPGLAAVLVAQACFVRGPADRRALIAGAFVAGLAAGLRVQTVWLTMPLMMVALIAQRRTSAWWLLSRPIAALAAGVLVWAIPLLIATGGINGYLRALGTQAAEDFAWVDMVWANPTRRRIAFALYESLVLPWSSWWLAGVVAAATAAGAVVLLLRDRRALALLLTAFLPYFLFHVLFQETVTVRYALPVVPLVAYLAAAGVVAARRFAPIAGLAIVGLAAAAALPAGVAYGREPHPAFRAIADMSAAVGDERPASVFAHFALRRPLQTAAARSLPLVEPQRNGEWLGPVRYWRGGGTAPIWFLADPKRTDLESIDPVARRAVTHYRWRVAGDGPLSGVRPAAADWYRLEPPGWYTTEGWSLTPETGGLTVAARSGPDHRPIEAFVRARTEAAYLMIGVHHLGTAGDGAAAFELSMNGRPLDSWTLDPARGPNVLRIVPLPEGVPSEEGGYARVTVVAHAATAGRATPPVAVRQFDVQSATGLIHAFGDGWYEDEYDNATGRRWRWTSGRAELRIVPPQAVRLTLRGESPVKYVHAVPTVRVTAGGRVIGELHPSADFTWQVTVPAGDILRSNGIIMVETDRVFVQPPIDGAVDTRHLGLRMFEIDVNPALP